MGKVGKQIDIEKYIVRLPQKRRVLDWRKFIIPTGWKRKRNISGNIDRILYGAKK